MRLNRLALPVWMAVAALALADREAVRGQILDITGDKATIDVGESHGVTTNMIFEIYKPARMVEVPMTGDVVYQAMEVIGSLVVYEVEPSKAKGRIENHDAAKSLVKVGYRIAENRVRKEEEQPPIVADFTASAASAPWNTDIKLTVKAVDPNGGSLIYRWSATGGKLAYAVTTRPENTWTAPLASGPYTVTVAVRDATQKEAVGTKELRSAGQPLGWRPRNFPSRGFLGDQKALFTRIADIDFDDAGNAYILDPETRMVVKLDTAWKVLAAYGPYPTKYDFIRLEVLGSQAYLLDRYAHAVFMFRLNAKDTFGGTPLTVFGKEGSYGVNGELVTPTDLAVTDRGEVYVLDKQTGIVHLFDSKGNFQLSIGSKSAAGAAGLAEKPAAIAMAPNGDLAIVDDGASKKALIYRNYRFLHEIPCGDAKESMVAANFDPITGKFFVLSNTGGDANIRPIKAFNNAPRGQGVSFGLTATELPVLANMQQVSRIKVSPTGEVFVVAKSEKEWGQELFRYTPKGLDKWEFLGKWGGEARNVEYITKIAADAAGNVAGLAPDLDMVLVFNSEGWITSKFGHIDRTQEKLLKPVDLAMDDEGAIYVLDAEHGNVRKYTAGGVLTTSLGSPGTSGSQISDAVDLAVGDKFVYVLMNREGNNILRMNSAGGGASLSFPSQPDADLERPSTIAASGKMAIASSNKRGHLRRFTEKNNNFFPDKNYAPHSKVNAYDDLTALGTGLLLSVCREDGAFSDDYYVLVIDGNMQLIGTVSDDMANNCPLPIDGAGDGFGSIFVLDGQNHRIAIFKSE